jgi:formylglycine-generating enzyme required for sulfatase activity
MPAMDSAAAAASVPQPRPSQIKPQKSVTSSTPKVSSTAPTHAPVEDTRSSAGKKRGGLAPILFGGIAVVVLAGAGIFVMSGNNPPVQKKAATPAKTTGSTPVAAAPRQPPQPGRPWKNSLGMTYVPLDDIWMAATETRVRDFEAFVQATNYDATGGMDSLQKDGFKDHGHSWKDPGFKQSPEHPVVGISREDANYFCKWLTDKERSAGGLTAYQYYRLPTDREWSVAVGLPGEAGNTPEERSGKVKGVYPWGYTFPPPENTGNYAGTEASAGAPAKWPFIPTYHDPFPRTAPVPSSTPNRLGIADLGGNVWEWCQDSFGKTNSRWGVLRGGSWATSRPDEMLSSFRRGFDPSFREDDVGFRCVIATGSGDR